MPKKGRKQNPLEAQQRSSRHYKELLPRRADLWLRAAQLQAERCATFEAASDDRLIEMEFFVVAAQWLCDVTRVANDVFELPAVVAAINDFKDRWPQISNLRHIQEHAGIFRGDPSSLRGAQVNANALGGAFR